MKKANKATRKKKAAKRPRPDEMRPHYDFAGGVRGKYAAEYAEAANKVIVLDRDVAVRFADAQAVNEALREYLRNNSK